MWNKKEEKWTKQQAEELRAVTILKSSQHHPRVWGTGPNFHDAVLLGFWRCGPGNSLSPTLSLSLALPLLLLYLFPFWVPLRRVGVKGTSSFPCDEHKSCSNRIQTWGNWWVPAADRLHKRCWHTGRQQQVLIKPQTPTPLIHSLFLFPSTRLAHSCSTWVGANQMSACVFATATMRRVKHIEVKEKCSRRGSGGCDRQVGGQRDTT